MILNSFEMNLLHCPETIHHTILQHKQLSIKPITNSALFNCKNIPQLPLTADSQMPNQNPISHALALLNSCCCYSNRCCFCFYLDPPVVSIIIISIITPNLTLSLRPKTNKENHILVNRTLKFTYHFKIRHHLYLNNLSALQLIKPAFPFVSARLIQSWNWPTHPMHFKCMQRNCRSAPCLIREESRRRNGASVTGRWKTSWNSSKFHELQRER